MASSRFAWGLGPALLISGGALAIVSLALPWLSFAGVSISGLQMLQVHSAPIAVAVVGVTAIATGCLVGLGSPVSSIGRYLSGGAAALVLLWGLFSLSDIVKLGTNASLGLSIDLTRFLGIGVWAAFVSGLTIVAGSTFGIGSSVDEENVIDDALVRADEGIGSWTVASSESGNTKPSEPFNADEDSRTRDIELLRQLASLRDEGIISAADFNSKKAELLHRI